MNESIESTRHERVHFQGFNSMALFTFKNQYCASSSRFGTHIVSTVILTNYECTHKATTRHSNNKTKCLKWILLAVKNPTPHGTHLLALSHILIIYNYVTVFNFHSSLSSTLNLKREQGYIRSEAVRQPVRFRH